MLSLCVTEGSGASPAAGKGRGQGWRWPGVKLEPPSFNHAGGSCSWAGEGGRAELQSSALFRGQQKGCQHPVITQMLPKYL